MFPFAALLILVGVTTAFAQSADEGVVYMKTALRPSPSMSARSSLMIEPETRVRVLAWRGLWLQVRLLPVGAQTGWVRRFDVRLDRKASQTTARESESGFGRIMGGLFGGQEGRKDPPVTATIGVRGLDAVDLKNATPDPRRLRMLEGFQSEPGNAARSAKLAGLMARKVDYLTEDSTGGVWDDTDQFFGD